MFDRFSHQPRSNWAIMVQALPWAWFLYLTIPMLETCMMLPEVRLMTPMLLELHRELCNQCDQIWRNFTTLAKFWKPLVIFWGLILHLAKLWTDIGIFLLFGKLSLMLVAKFSKKLSSHLVTLFVACIHKLLHYKMLLPTC